MKIPGPDHPITVTPAGARWRVYFAGHVIADTADAVILQEASYPQVVYFPREDVSMEYFGRTQHASHCPYKGDASYYTVTMDGQIAENGVWSYETPYPAMEPIAGRLAFYPDKFEVYAVDDAEVNPKHAREAARDDATAADRAEVDQVVQHTDSGSGAPQRAHWAPNVDGPSGDATNDGGLN